MSHKPSGVVIEVKTAYELEAWVRSAHAGERVKYHEGHLAADRQGTTRLARRVNALAAFACDLGEIDQLEYRPCGHLKSIKAGARVLRLLQQKQPKEDPEQPSSWCYIAELLP
jgi:hypothetical protein